jgi:hypothetical protein
MSKLESGVVRQVHTAFSAVSGARLVAGHVPGLQVRVTREIPALELDLYAQPAMRIAVNPTWARSCRPATLRDVLESAARDEIV